MKFDLDTPVFFTNEDVCTYPSANGTDGEGSNGSFALGTSADLINSIATHVAEAESKSQTLTETTFNKVLNSIAESRSITTKDNLAFLNFNKAGALVATMGKCRVVQFRPNAEDMIYDSANQIVDIYSSKAAVELQTDVMGGDIFLLCSNAKFDCHELTKSILEDNSLKALSSCIDAMEHKTSVAVVKVEKVTGQAMKIKDMTALWYALFALLGIGIVVLALSTFITNKFGNATAVSMPEEVATDSDTTIEPAVQVAPEPKEFVDTVKLGGDSARHEFHKAKNRHEEEIEIDNEKEENTNVVTQPAEEPTSAPATEPIGDPEP